MPTDVTTEATTDVTTDAMTVETAGKMIGMEVPAAAAATGHLEWPTYHLRSS